MDGEVLVPVIGTELGAVGLDGREADLLRGAYNTELGVVGRVGNGAGCVLISWFLFLSLCFSLSFPQELHNLHDSPRGGRCHSPYCGWTFPPFMKTPIVLD